MLHTMLVAAGILCVSAHVSIRAGMPTPRTAVFRTSSPVMEVQAADEQEITIKASHLRMLMDAAADQSASLDAVIGKLAVALEEDNKSVPSPQAAVPKADADGIVRTVERAIFTSAVKSGEVTKLAKKMVSQLSHTQVELDSCNKALRQTTAKLQMLRARADEVETQLAQMRVKSYVQTNAVRDERKEHELRVTELLREQESLFERLAESEERLAHLALLSNSLATTLGWVVAASGSPDTLKELVRKAAGWASDHTIAEVEAAETAGAALSELDAADALLAQLSAQDYQSMPVVVDGVAAAAAEASAQQRSSNGIFRRVLGSPFRVAGKVVSTLRTRPKADGGKADAKSADARVPAGARS